MKEYNVVILGAGPAGLTAAIYSGRYGLKNLVIAKQTGGMANLASKIENYPGFIGTGLELMKKFYEQAKKFRAEFLDSEVASIEKDKTGFVIYLSNEKVIHAKSLIIALGTEKKKLSIKGEEKFLGRGVSYCAVCDANFFRGKVVAVIGGSDSACHAALLLNKIAKKVYLVYRGNELRCSAEKEKVSKIKNIEIIYNAVPLEIKGKDIVKSLVIEQKEKKKEIKLDGIFVEIGSMPVSAIVRKLGIKTDKNGFILVDEEMKTNAKGVFAAGDIVKSKLKQIIVATSQGAIAANSAREFLR